jgi:hypothetical protein
MTAITMTFVARLLKKGVNPKIIMSIGAIMMSVF